MISQKRSISKAVFKHKWRIEMFVPINLAAL